MSATSNHEQNALIPQWPHEQLTHLAVHTPIPVTRGVESSAGVMGNGVVPTSFSASSPLGFSVQQTSPFGTVGYPQSELFRQLPPVFNNNNTKLDPDTPINADPIKSEFLTRHNDLWSQMAAMVNQNQRPHSALNNAELASAQSAAPELHAIIHHPLLSPGLRSSAICRVAKEEATSEHVALRLSSPASAQNLQQIQENAVHLSPLVAESKTESAADEPQNANQAGTSNPMLNDEEQARLLLAVSQNLSGVISSENSSDALASTPSVSAENGRAASQGKSRTFFRPPGHEAPTTPSDGNGWICPRCGFGCSSKFHYNSHMNTHGCHECKMCSYTSRTEGRLKKHMLESHTLEQRQEVAAANGELPMEANRTKSNDNTQQSIRLPSVLEHIRVLADNGGAVQDDVGEDSNSSGQNENTQTTPVKRSTGKPKKYECKQCKHISTTKEASWIHNRIHIPVEKQMCCKICPFITEYRHHLIYHERGHKNEKPFKCSKCEYTCVNKSMLNSHMKSHTPLYQFRCQDCTYQTKYCHSLKMHTQKYNHRRVQGQVLGDENSDTMDENLEEMETESMKNYDIPVDDLEALERHRREQNGQFSENNSQPTMAIAQSAVQSSGASNGASQLRLSTATPRLNSLLHQPIATSNNAQQLHQFLLHQQQVNRMNHEPMLHGFMARPKCDLCEFTANSQDELLAHKINHFVLRQQQPQQQLNLYGNLNANPLLFQSQQHAFQELVGQLRNGIALRNQQAQSVPSTLPSAHLHGANSLGKSELNDHDDQEVKLDNRAIETPEASGATTNTTASTPRVGINDGYNEEHTSGSSETHEEAIDTSSSPSDSHKSMDAASSSPHSSAPSTTAHVGAKKRKANKLELISQRLQGKNSPDTTEDHMDTDHVDDKQNSTETSNLNNNSLVQPIPLGPLANGAPNHQLNSLIAQFSNDIQDRRATMMPYTCQHCVIAFQDQALYQIHLGFHGYELPFKCNRCGYNAATALDFNLHLYQEKH
ncbi:hypothetical protein M3Y94_00800600 [Aphelenchoides besseyi]|nr:hypothetical protein M3Y94_00800600 [Aphelenchoides besseyi]KAI6232532.1 hypothetical protein M3Y95_00495700 [Aphelenchoides besseyi]